MSRQKMISNRLASNNKGGTKKGYRSFSYTYGMKGDKGYAAGTYRGRKGSVSEAVRKSGITPAKGKGATKRFTISGGGKAGKVTAI